MIRAALRLAVIFVLVAAGVHWGYSQLERRLLSEVCKPLRGRAAARPEQAAAAAPKPGEPAVQDFQVIVRRNIFQPVAAAAPPSVEKTAPPPVPTSLNLSLVGTVTGLEQGSWAVIADNAKKKQQLVKTGGKIAGTGAVVRSIAWNQVTLEVNGRIEVLEMPKPKPGKAGVQAQAARDVNRVELPEEPTLPAPEEMVPAEQQVPPPVLRPHRRVNLPGQEMEPPPQAAEEPPLLPELEDVPLPEDMLEPELEHELPPPM